ncbi:MAG: cation transporter [Gemmatimonadota bacterium]
MAVSALPAPGDRAALVRRGLRLNYVTIGYNALEAVGSIAAGLVAGSVALVGFGVDSIIEVTASGAAQWRLRADVDPARRERVERIAHRGIGLSFLALAAYVAGESAMALWHREPPERSLPGVVILALSVLVMPALARAKRRVARALVSSALDADATQTALCACLSVIALIGVALNAILGWWWADPVAALVMVPIIAKEGLEGLRGTPTCSDCAGH